MTPSGSDTGTEAAPGRPGAGAADGLRAGSPGSGGAGTQTGPSARTARAVGESPRSSRDTQGSVIILGSPLLATRRRLCSRPCPYSRICAMPPIPPSSATACSNARRRASMTSASSSMALSMGRRSMSSMYIEVHNHGEICAGDQLGSDADCPMRERPAVGETEGGGGGRRRTPMTAPTASLTPAAPTTPSAAPWPSPTALPSRATPATLSGGKPSAPPCRPGPWTHPPPR